MAGFEDIYQSFLGYDPDEANKNILGSAYKSMGRNTLKTDIGNALTGAATYQPNQGAAPIAGLVGKQVGGAMADWMKRLFTNKVGYLAGDSPITPAPGVPLDLFNVGSTGSTAFDFSKLVPSGSDLATAGLNTALDVTGLGQGPIGKGVKAAGSAGIAASQGFMNPASDADFIYKFFNALGLF